MRSKLCCKSISVLCFTLCCLVLSDVQAHVPPASAPQCDKLLTQISRKLVRLEKLQKRGINTTFILARRDVNKSLKAYYKKECGLLGAICAAQYKPVCGTFYERCGDNVCTQVPSEPFIESGRHRFGNTCELINNQGLIRRFGECPLVLAPAPIPAPR